MLLAKRHRTLLYGGVALAVTLAVLLHFDSNPPPTATTSAPRPLDVAPAIEGLETWLGRAVAGETDPSRLAEALRGLGRNHRTAQGLLVEQLVHQLAASEETESYALAAEGPLPLPLLTVLNALLEADFPLEQPLAPGLTPSPTLHTLASRLGRSAENTSDALDWQRTAVELDTLALAHGRGALPDSVIENMTNLARRAFDELEQEHRIFRRFLGRGPEAADHAGTELWKQKQAREKIYGLEGAGLPLTNALLRAFITLESKGVRNSLGPEALARLTGALIARESLERPWPATPEPDPAGLALHGRWLETIGLTTLASGDRDLWESRAQAERLSRAAEAAAFFERFATSPSGVEAIDAATALLRGLKLARSWPRPR